MRLAALSKMSLGGAAGLRLRKASPTILIFAGIGGVVTATVMACKATLKAEQILEETQEKFEKIEEVAENHPDEYTSEDKRKDKAATMIQCGLKLVKTYGPSIAIGAASVMAILGSHKIMVGRNVALAAAYGVLDKGFNSYRERVREELGDNLDQHFLHGTEEKVIETKEVDSETGKEKKKKVKGLEIPSDVSLYGRWFDRTCGRWENNKDHNLMFLKQAEEYFNMRLQAKGFVFLNEVYDYLGIDMTPEGQCVGWLKGHGDDFVDFRIWNNSYADVESRGDYYIVRKMASDNSVYGNDIFLDFNVDGPILEMI